LIICLILQGCEIKIEEGGGTNLKPDDSSNPSDPGNPSKPSDPSDPGSQTGTCVETLAIGDFGTQNGEQQYVAGGLAKVAGQLNPDSILGLGDTVYEDGHVNGIEPTMRIYTDHQALRKPWHMITGNHDWYNDATLQKDYKQNQYWNMPDFFYKTQHKAGDVTVDVFHIDTEIWTCFADIGAGGGGRKHSFHHDNCGQYRKAQEDWLRSQLSSSSASYKVVVGHHPMYSIGLHGHEDNVHSHLRGLLADIMKEGGANIYMSGHDHSIQYTYANGFHQIISGGGAKTCRGGEKWGNVPSNSNKFFHCDKGFVGVRFCKNEVTLTAYDGGGNTLKDFTLS
jgi:acid phosphatase